MPVHVASLVLLCSLTCAVESIGSEGIPRVAGTDIGADGVHTVMLAEVGVL